MYHYVRPIKNSAYPGINGLEHSDFIEQVKYIVKHYNPVSIEDVMAYYYNNVPLPPKAILLTFDDNYIDHYSYVFPVLHQYKIKGAFYSPVRAVMESSVLTVNKIHYALAAEKDENKILKFIFEQLDELRKSHPLLSNEEYLQQFAHQKRYDNATISFIKKFVQKGLPRELREELSNKMLERFTGLTEKMLSAELYMNTKQIEEMIQSGMHFGMHGYHHDWMNSLDEKEQESEIVKSMSFLQKIGMDREKLTICYPYGEYNSTTLELLKKYQCKLGFTVHLDLGDKNAFPALEIPRLNTNDLPVNASTPTNIWYERA